MVIVRILVLVAIILLPSIEAVAQVQATRPNNRNTHEDL